MLAATVLGRARRMKSHHDRHHHLLRHLLGVDDRRSRHWLHADNHRGRWPRDANPHRLVLGVMEVLAGAAGPGPDGVVRAHLLFPIP
jgi:hypothetical protein